MGIERSDWCGLADWRSARYLKRPRASVLRDAGHGLDRAKVVFTLPMALAGLRTVSLDRRSGDLVHEPHGVESCGAIGDGVLPLDRTPDSGSANLKRLAAGWRVGGFLLVITLTFVGARELLDKQPRLGLSAVTRNANDWYVTESMKNTVPNPRASANHALSDVASLMST